MTTVRECELVAAIQAADAEESSLGFNPVEVSYVDGWMPPRRCCKHGCRATIDGAPLVSRGLPYHAACYASLRRSGALN